MATSDTERNDFIRKCIAEGMSLSKVQDALNSELGITMTYMELRMLTSELAVSWEAQDKKREMAKAKTAPQPPRQQESSAAVEDVPAQEMDDEMQQEVQEESADADAQPQDAPAKDGVLRGQTTVGISKVVRPGTSLSGNVTFGSGASGEWYVDQFGRLGLNLDEGSAKPDDQDIQEFQVELKKALGY